MKLTVYADFLFLVNLLLDFMILSMVSVLNGINVRTKRIVIGSATGAALTLIPLWISVGGVLPGITYRFVSALLINGFTFSFIPLGTWLCNTAIFYAVSACMGGLLNMVGDKSINKLPWLLTITFVVTLVTYITRYMRGNFLRNRYLYQIEVVYKKKSIKAIALLDSGNHLYEPISGKPVILLSDKAIEQLNPDSDGFRVVPYSSVGKKNGLLNAYRIDRLTIYGERKIIKTDDVYVAAAELVEDGHGRYRAVLHPDLFLRK